MRFRNQFNILNSNIKTLSLCLQHCYGPHYITLLNMQTICFCLVWFFRSQSTGMVMSDLTTLFSWASLTQAVNQYYVHILSQVTDNNLLESAMRRMAVEIFHDQSPTKVLDRAGIKLATPGTVVRHVSAFRRVTNCATRPS